jgi:hypothetical protein
MDDTKIGRLLWVGHVTRPEEETIPKTIFLVGNFKREV